MHVVSQCCYVQLSLAACARDICSLSNCINTAVAKICHVSYNSNIHYTARQLAAAQCIVIGPVCVFVTAGRRVVSEPYYSQRMRSACVSLSAFSFYSFCKSDTVGQATGRASGIWTAKMLG